MNNLPATSPDINENYEKLKNAIADARKQGDTKAVVSLLKQLGQAYMQAGDAPQALTEFNEAIKLVSNGEDNETFAQLLGFRGLALKLIGNYSLAMHAFRKSHTLALEIKHPALSCDSLIHIASLHSEMGKLDEAFTALTDALKVASENRDKVRKMRLYGLLGDNSLKRIEPAKASEYFQMAHELAQDLGNQAAESSFITKLGNVLLLEGNTDRAINQYERALKLASALEDRNAEINILGGLFRAHALAADLYPAQVYAEQAIHLSAQIGHFEAEVANIQALAAFLIEHGQFDKVFHLLERGLQVAREQVNPGLEMELLNLTGQAYSLQEKYDEALISWDTALVQASMLQDEPFMAAMLGQMGAIYAEKGEIEKSIAAAERALQLALNAENVKLAAQQQILLAFNFNDLNQKERAIQFCNAAVNSFENVGDAEMVAQAQALLAELEN
jgi:tetratricopeptide (TPR) repeat protein